MESYEEADKGARLPRGNLYTLDLNEDGDVSWTSMKHPHPPWMQLSGNMRFREGVPIFSCTHSESIFKTFCSYEWKVRLYRWVAHRRMSYSLMIERMIRGDSV